MGPGTLARYLTAALFFAGCLSLSSPRIEGCTRCVYLGPNETVMVGRSMDWAEDPGTNLYCFPRGMKRDGAAGPQSIAWASKYGSVVSAFYDVATVDGMNEKGLVANVLYLVESDYGKPDGTRPLLSIAAWGQYVLDQYASVQEAVEGLRAEPFAIVAPMLPNGLPGQGHLSISDPTGDSAIFEYVNGQLVIYHDRKYQVMTNSPTFDQQLAINAYWEEIGGLAMLPGTNRAADRFARASFFLKSTTKTDDTGKARAALLSVIRSSSVPLGISTPGQPNIAGTVWRTLSDSKQKVYYFESASSPAVFFRVPLAELDFREGAPVKKLDLAGGKVYTGNASSQFQTAKPFEFLYAK